MCGFFFFFPVLCNLTTIQLKRDESIRIRKEAEEAKFQKMKAIQREKSNKLEEKKQLQEDIRRATFREHHQSKTAELLSRLDTERRNRSACLIAPPATQSSRWKLPVLLRDPSWVSMNWGIGDWVSMNWGYR